MKYSFAVLMIFLAYGSSFAADSKNQVTTRLLNSLKCEPNDGLKILDAFRDLKGKNQELAKLGITIRVEGDEAMEEIYVDSKEPVELLGAKSTHFESYFGRFNTFGEFVGNPEPFINTFKMKAHLDPENKEDFLSAPLTNSKRECVKIMRLQKIGNNKFRFGCYWCKG